MKYYKLTSPDYQVYIETRGYKTIDNTTYQFVDVDRHVSISYNKTSIYFDSPSCVVNESDVLKLEEITDIEYNRIYNACSELDKAKNNLHNLLYKYHAH